MKPLEGIKVIDFTEGHNGGAATMMMADYGAEVIKIEKPGTGDVVRTWAPMKNGSSGYHAYLNRGKKSVAVDVKTEAGKHIVEDLIRGADIVVENLPYGKIEHIGFGYETVKALNPKIIYASVSGYGRSGPDKEKPFGEAEAQAAGGIFNRTGFEERPLRGGVFLAGHLSAMYTLMSVSLCLADREKTGEGRRIDISMQDCIYSVLEGHPMVASLKGKAGPRVGNADLIAQPYDTLPTMDGYICLGVSTDPQWENFCDALGLDEMKANEKYKTNAGRCQYYYESMEGELIEFFKDKSKFDIEEKLWEKKVPAGAYYTTVGAMETQECKDRNMLVDVYDEGIGENVTMPGLVYKMMGTPSALEEGAPLLGKNTKEYLEKLGYSEEMIQKMADDKVVQLV